MNVTMERAVRKDKVIRCTVNKCISSEAKNISYRRSSLSYLLRCSYEKND